MLRSLLLAVLVAALAGWLYAPVGSFGFVSFDDPVYVSENEAVGQGLTQESVTWALTADFTANWHPLTWWSHMLDVELFGLDPGPHHLENAALHALVSALLFVFLASATGRRGPSLFAALLFALHPLRVESVAWISERKDLLAGLFWMLTLLAWGGWVRRRSRGCYALALLCMLAGIMSKPIVVTLPCVLLLLDVWPFARYRPDGPGVRRLLIEKLPFFALVAFSSVVTYLVQREGGAMLAADTLSVAERLANAPLAYAGYLRRFVWPTGLAALYPHPALQLPDGLAFSQPRVLGSLALLAVLTLLALRLGRRRPYVPVGWAWMLGVMVPMVGLVQVGLQGLADRYTYLPMMGLGLVVAFGGSELLARIGWLRCVPAVLLLAACAYGTRQQLESWRDSVALYTRVLALDPLNAVAHFNVGLLRKKQGDEAGATEAFRTAGQVVSSSRSKYLRILIGQALVESGLPDEAEPLLEGWAEVHPEKAAEIGVFLAQRALQRSDLALARQRLDEVFAVAPRQPDASYLLGLLLNAQGDGVGAVAALRDAVAQEPPRVEALYALVELLASSPDDRVRNGRDALQFALKGVAMTQGQHAGLLAGLSAAYAELGDFQNAALTVQKAIELQPEVSARWRQQLMLYLQGQPYRRP